MIARTISFKKFLDLTDELSKKTAIRYSGANSRNYCFKHDIDGESFFILWIVKNDLDSDSIEKYLEILSLTFVKANRRLELAFEQYHRNTLILQLRYSSDDFYMEYHGAGKPILCSNKYIDEIHKNASNKKYILHVCSVFAETLHHECEHGLQDLKSRVDRLDQLFFSEGMAELTSFFTHNTLFNPQQYKSLNNVEKNRTKNTIIKKPQYDVGFYLMMLVFIQYVQDKDKNFLRNFSSLKFSEVIRAMKDMKHILKKMYGDEKLRDLVVSFRELMYKQNKYTIIQKMKSIEQELDIKSDYAQHYL